MSSQNAVLVLGETYKCGPTRLKVEHLDSQDVQYSNQRTGKFTVEKRKTLEAWLASGKLKKIVSESCEKVEIPMNVSFMSREQKYLSVLAFGGRFIFKTKELKLEAKKIAAAIGDDAPPCNATLYRWRNSYACAQNLVMWENKTPKTRNRLPWSEQELMKAAIDEVYLKGSKNTLKDAYSSYEEKSIELNKGSDFKPVYYETFRLFLKRVYSEYEIVLNRDGYFAAEKQFKNKYKKSVYEIPKRPFQRVEMDHTVADIFIVLPNGKKIRPTVTVIVDCFTRVILAILVTVEAPNRSTAILAIKSAMSDKTSLLSEEMRKQGYIWDMCGKPVVLVLDNGAEFHSDDFVEVADKLGITLQYCPPGMPNYKGISERLIKTIMYGCVHKLSGTTHGIKSNKKGLSTNTTTKAKAEAALTLYEYSQILYDYVATYHKSLHRTLGCTPMDKWNASVNRCATQKVDEDIFAHSVFATSREVTYSDGRVQRNNLRYSSRDFRNWHSQYATGNKLRSWINHDDVSDIKIETLDGKHSIIVPCVTDGIDKGTTLQQAMAFYHLGNHDGACDPQFRITKGRQNARNSIADSSCKSSENYNPRKMASAMDAVSNLSEDDCQEGDDVSNKTAVTAGDVQPTDELE